MMGVEFDACHGHGGVFGREPDGSVATQGAEFESVSDAEHAALQGEEFTLGRRGVHDLREALICRSFEGLG